MSNATFYNTNINQGSKFVLNVQARNSDGSVMDLTGYSARMQVRETVDSVDVLLEATTTDGSITIPTPASGVVMVRIGGDVTEALTFNTGKYDLEIYKVSDPTEVIRIVEGNISLHLEVTR